MKISNALAVIGLLTSITFNANALVIGDSNYIGQIVNGTPANPSNEVIYINELLALSAGASPTPCTNNTCDRLGSTLDVTGFEAAVLLGANADNSPSTEIDVTDYQYLYGKFGGFAAAWYVGNLSGTQTLPTDANGNQSGGGFSHWALYNPSQSVPEPSVLLLLGLGFIGLGFARRRKA